MNSSRRYSPAAAAIACLLLAGCGNDYESASGTGGTSSPPGGTSSPPPATSNSEPLIYGSAPGPATVGQAWSYQPSLYDADGDSLTVTASNLPQWMSLNRTSGRLSGTPDEGDVRTWSGIRLTVSDGIASASSPEFAVLVVDPNAGGGTVTLSWLPPTQQVDGSPIGELSGYRLLFGQASREYSQAIDVDNPGITRYTIDGLGSGDWYFAIQTIDAQGLISDPSAEAYTRI